MRNSIRVRTEDASIRTDHSNGNFSSPTLTAFRREGFDICLHANSFTDDSDYFAVSTCNHYGVSCAAYREKRNSPERRWQREQTHPVRSMSSCFQLQCSGINPGTRVRCDLNPHSIFVGLVVRIAFPHSKRSVRFWSAFWRNQLSTEREACRNISAGSQMAVQSCGVKACRSSILET